MISNSPKYKVQDISYPHIGRFLRQYFSKSDINRAELSRRIGVADSTSTSYIQRQSIQVGILCKMSIALKHNLLADLAMLLPVAFKTPREKELEMESETLKQEVNELKIDNKTYKNLLSNK